MTSLRGLKLEHLHAVVDMGSNGIRFSISDLSEPTARILPTIYQDRAGISLYDAQFSTGERGPIPRAVIDDVVTRLVRFKSTCEDFGVPPNNIYVLATEATRTASNSAEFTRIIKRRTGWDTQMLSKEDEGRIGALGVASSFVSIEGLVMDLGGGSTQITWMIARDGQVSTSPKGSMSFPYGAAALTRRLEEARRNGAKAEQELKDEMKANFQNAYNSLDVPQSLKRTAQSRAGFDLYLCGGGFRGWGYLLMSRSRLNPYPIPIINGFKANRADFHDTLAVMNTAVQADTKIFRVSKRRASQVPAVALLVNVLAEALPTMKSIQFCQGGVREGFLYEKLEIDVRKQDPLLVATAPYAPASADLIRNLLNAALPDTSSPILSRRPPPTFTSGLLLAVANLCFAHSFVSRESRPAAGLYSTTTGILASANSLAHSDRALLSLILSERWPGDLAPAEQAFQHRLRQFVSAEEAWWCQYLGRVAALIGDTYPAGRIPEQRIEFRANWKQVFKKKQGTIDALCLKVSINEAMSQSITPESLRDTVERIEKIGKKKNWIMAKDRLEAEWIAGDYGASIEIRSYYANIPRTFTVPVIQVCSPLYMLWQWILEFLTFPGANDHWHRRSVCRSRVDNRLIPCGPIEILAASTIHGKLTRLGLVIKKFARTSSIKLLVAFRLSSPCRATGVKSISHPNDDCATKYRLSPETQYVVQDGPLRQN